MISNLPVLLVEDDIVDVKTVERAFRDAHVTNPLHVVSNGPQALDFLRRQGDFQTGHERRPGIILLDLNMPGMPGIEVLREIKSDDNLKSIPVIVLTTSNIESDRFACYAGGVAGYFVKPVDYHDFVKIVATIDQYWKLSEAAQ
jgi:CheY-like chemotaxis protein